MTTHVGFGQRLGALPSGRHAGRPIADGISPTNGADRRGPTASLLAASLACGPHVGNGLALNEKLDPCFVAGPAGTRLLDDLTRGYFAAGGQQVQFNILDPAVLLDAKLHPERPSRPGGADLGLQRLLQRPHRGDEGRPHRPARCTGTCRAVSWSPTRPAPPRARTARAASPPHATLRRCRHFRHPALLHSRRPRYPHGDLLQGLRHGLSVVSEPGSGAGHAGARVLPGALRGRLRRLRRGVPGTGVAAGHRRPGRLGALHGLRQVCRRLPGGRAAARWSRVERR